MVGSVFIYGILCIFNMFTLFTYSFLLTCSHVNHGCVITVVT